MRLEEWVGASFSRPHVVTLDSIYLAMLLFSEIPFLLILVSWDHKRCFVGDLETDTKQQPCFVSWHRTLGAGITGDVSNLLAHLGGAEQHWICCSPSSLQISSSVSSSPGPPKSAAPWLRLRLKVAKDTHSSSFSLELPVVMWILTYSHGFQFGFALVHIWLAFSHQSSWFIISLGLELGREATATTSCSITIVCSLSFLISYLSCSVVVLFVWSDPVTPWQGFISNGSHWRVPTWRVKRPELSPILSAVWGVAWSGWLGQEQMWGDLWQRMPMPSSTRLLF